MTWYSTYDRTNAGLEALKHGESQVGLPYIWGGETPGVGFDCSGLTEWSYRSVGLYIPRTTYTQYKVCELGRGASLLPGDLLFINEGENGVPGPGHVMMYHSPGLVLQAPFTGEDVNVGPYNTEVYVYASRPANLYGAPVQGPTGKDLRDNKLVRLINDVQAALALKNGWQVRGFNGVNFPVLPFNGVPVGVCKYAVTDFRKPR
jgi:hypothetical protein